MLENLPSQHFYRVEQIKYKSHQIASNRGLGTPGPIFSIWTSTLHFSHLLRFRLRLRGAENIGPVLATRLNDNIDKLNEWDSINSIFKWENDTAKYNVLRCLNLSRMEMSLFNICFIITYAKKVKVAFKYLQKWEIYLSFPPNYLDH